MKKITHNDYGKPGVEKRSILWGDSTPRAGRTTITCFCPFCGTYVIAYLWSLAGGGKRCTNCQALLTRYHAIQFELKVDNVA